MQYIEQQQARKLRCVSNSDIYQSSGMCQWPLHKIRQSIIASACGKYLNSLTMCQLLDIETGPFGSDRCCSCPLSLCRQELGFHCRAQWLWAAPTGACWEPHIFLHRGEGISTPWKRDGQGWTAYTPPPRWGGARWGHWQVKCLLYHVIGLVDIIPV